MGSEHRPKSTDNPQAIVLYTFCDRCPAVNNEFLNRLYYVVGFVSFWGFRGSTNAASSLGFYRYGSQRVCHGYFRMLTTS